MCEAATSGLSIAASITGSRGLNSDEMLAIRAGILKQIISDACSPQQGTGRPAFNGEPMVVDNDIRLWCANSYTITWLKETVRKLSIPFCFDFEVKDDQKRTVGRFSFPDEDLVYKGEDDIKRTLRYQNPGIDFNRLEDIHISHRSIKSILYWNVQITFPEDQKRALENGGCKLIIGYTPVNVVLENKSLI